LKREKEQGQGSGHNNSRHARRVTNILPVSKQDVVSHRAFRTGGAPQQTSYGPPSVLVQTNSITLATARHGSFVIEPTLIAQSLIIINPLET
jgi:hypothetical protein